MPDGSLPSTLERVVPSDFPRGGHCRIALVGEAPGDHEVDKLRPFVGPSGSCLNSMLRAAGIDREQCYVGNVFSTQLVGNDVSKHRQFLGAENWEKFYNDNVARLAAELAAVNPNVVVPLGGTALAALAGTTQIAQFRGAVRMGTEQFASYKLLPTYHPAMVLRQWSVYTVCIGDLIRAEAQSQIGPTITWPVVTLEISPTIEQVEAYLAGPCRETPLLSCDIETGWGQIRGVSFAPNKTEALYCPFISLDNLTRSYWRTAAEEKRAWLAVKGVLECPVPKLGQNFANYDVIWLLTKMGIRVNGLGDDLRLLHKALYPELPASLQFMASAYSEQGQWKHWGRGKKHGGSEDDKRDA